MNKNPLGKTSILVVGLTLVGTATDKIWGGPALLILGLAILLGYFIARFRARVHPVLVICGLSAISFGFIQIRLDKPVRPVPPPLSSPSLEIDPAFTEIDDPLGSTRYYGKAGIHAQIKDPPIGTEVVKVELLPAAGGKPIPGIFGNPKGNPISRGADDLFVKTHFLRLKHHFQFPGVVRGVFSLAVTIRNGTRTTSLRPITNISFEDRQSGPEMGKDAVNASTSKKEPGSLTSLNWTYLWFSGGGVAYPSCLVEPERVQMFCFRLALGSRDGNFSLGGLGLEVKVAPSTREPSATFDGSALEEVPRTGHPKIAEHLFNSDYGRTWYLLIEGDQLVLGAFTSRGSVNNLRRWYLPGRSYRNLQWEGSPLFVKFSGTPGGVGFVSSSWIPRSFENRN